PLHEVRIVDSSGHELPDRTEGFLWFRGPSATSGYYKNPAATERLLPRGPATIPGEYAWVDSGDRAYRADGEIYVTGRVKDIIIKGGRNLYPHEVEELASRVEGIRKGCIVAFGLKDEGSGTEKLVIVAEVRDRDAKRRAAIAAAVTEQVLRGLGLPPDRVELTPPGSIPKTSSGKLRRGGTRKKFQRGAAGGGKTAGVGANRQAGSGQRGAQLRQGGACRHRARAGNAVRPLFHRGVLCVDRADLGDCVLLSGSSRCRAIYLVGA